MPVENLKASPAWDDVKDESLMRQIRGLIKTAHGPSVILTITPGVAQTILDEYNSDNRSPKPAKINEYAGYMLGNNWKLTGDTIKFSPLYLRDGQNRLYGCVKANVSLTSHFVFGLDDTIFPWLDRTKTRSNSDALHTAKIPNASDVSGTIRWLEMFRCDRVKDRVGLTPEETLAAYRGHYDALLIEGAIAAARKVSAADDTPKTIAAPLYYLFAKRNSKLADEFFEAWSTRNFGGRMKPLKKASEFIANLHTASFGRVHDVVRLAIWVITWNLVVERRIGSAPDFRWKLDSPFPRIKG